jgi:hypothetical protein
MLILLSCRTLVYTNRCKNLSASPRILSTSHKNRVPHLRRSFIAPKVGHFRGSENPTQQTTATTDVSLLFLFVIPEGDLLFCFAIAFGYPKASALGLSSAAKEKGLQPLGCGLQAIPTSEHPVNPQPTLTPSTPTTSKRQLISPTPL